MNNESKQEKILYRVKGNQILFIIRNIWNTICFIIGTVLSIGLGTLMSGGIYGAIFNNGKMNLTAVNCGVILTVMIIIIRILYIILMRKNQFYIISAIGITNEGGVLTRFNQMLRLNEIQSVSYTQTLIQQILGCGNIVISSASTYRAGIVLRDIDQVKEIYHIINNNR